MSNAKIRQALGNLFDKQRIVFWYDTRLEFRGEFEALELPGVEKIELLNNEFGVKHRLLREQPDQKFLLFREGPEPAYLDNWLLDVQLASGLTFRTDQFALWLAELELGGGPTTVAALAIRLWQVILEVVVAGSFWLWTRGRQSQDAPSGPKE